MINGGEKDLPVISTTGDRGLFNLEASNSDRKEGVSRTGGGGGGTSRGTDNRGSWRRGSYNAVQFKI